MGCSTSSEGGPEATAATGGGSSSSAKAPRSRHKKLADEEDSAYLTSTTWVDRDSLVLDKNGGSSSSGGDGGGCHLPSPQTTSARLTLLVVPSLLAERPPAALAGPEVSVEGAVSPPEVTQTTTPTLTPGGGGDVPCSAGAETPGGSAHF